MLLLRALNSAPIWLVILGVVAALELYSVGLMLLCRKIEHPPDLSRRSTQFLATAWRIAIEPFSTSIGIGRETSIIAYLPNAGPRSKKTS
jgi:hypothetical protein